MVLMKVKIRKENCLIIYYYSEKENWPPCIGEQLINEKNGFHILGGISLSWLPKHYQIKRA